MVDDRVSRGGLAVSALGSAVLAVSMFLPWYSLSFTASGAAVEQQRFANLADQYGSVGNVNMQTLANHMGAGFGALVGRPLATVSAHETLKDISAIVLLLAGLALLASLLRLADVFEVGRHQIALVGLVAALFVLFRMASPPHPHTDLVAYSLSWGSWVALGAAVAIIGGALWTPSVDVRHASESRY